jgi:hypothetical protein
MAWDEKECRPFDLYETNEGLYYQAVGTIDNPVEIQASEFIKALDRMAGDEREGRNEVKGIRVSHCRIDEDLDIRDAEGLERFEENGYEYIKLPSVELMFLYTVFNGHVFFGGEVDSNVGAFFSKEVIFNEVFFSGEARFRNSKFHDYVSFKSSTFEGYACFSEAIFEGKVSFTFSTFNEIVSFRAAKFSIDVGFAGVLMRCPATFVYVKFNENNVRSRFLRLFAVGRKQLFSLDAEFQDDLKEGNISEELRRKFKNRGLPLSKDVTVSVKQIDSEWFILGDCGEKYFVKKEEDGLKIYGRRGLESYITNFDSVNTNVIVDGSSNSYLKRYIEDEYWIKSWRSRGKGRNFLFVVWEVTSHCGRSVGLWAFWSLLIAIFFCLAYAHKEQIVFGLFGVASLSVATVCAIKKKWIGLTISVLVAVFFGLLCANIIPLPDSWQPELITSHSKLDGGYDGGKKVREPTWFTYIYFSVVTFTTLGFGDVTPINTAGEVLLTIEVILGYIMLGGLISIFANKLARRS